MSDEYQDQPGKPSARCGRGELDGAVVRPGDPVKHLGPPEYLHVRLHSQLFCTRCGLGSHDGLWRRPDPDENGDRWCPPCLDQAGISYELRPYDEDPGEVTRWPDRGTT